MGIWEAELDEEVIGGGVDMVGSVFCRLLRVRNSVVMGLVELDRHDSLWCSDSSASHCNGYVDVGRSDKSDQIIR